MDVDRPVMEDVEGDEPEVVCPFCGSEDTEFFSLFGSVLMTSQYYCRNCRTVFDRVKWQATRIEPMSRLPTFKTLLYDLQDGIATVALNRPEVRNAINDEMRYEFRTLSDLLTTNKAIEVVIITGTGDEAFSAGGDIGLFEQDWHTPAFRAHMRIMTDFFDDLEALEKPVIAAINGLAAGAGLQLTLSCDLRLASDRARFGFREGFLGLIPAVGGLSRLVKLIGYGKAKEFIFSGDFISAEEAERMGLVNRVVPHDELLPHARALAQKLQERAPQALGLAKRALWACVNSDLDTGRVIESLALSILLKTEDHREGVRAFREKRPPRFRGE